MAAFYRIDSNNTHKYILKGMNYNRDNYINILPVPVHHHQGIFKYKGKYYIAGSTQRSVPCYTYDIEEKNTIYPKNEKDNKDVEYTDPFLFNKGIINEYRHGGGLQIANGLLAIGIEKYDYSLKKGFGSASIDESVVLFYDLIEKKEHKYLRITYGSFYDRKLENDIAIPDKNKRKYKEDYSHDKETDTYEYIRGLKENKNFASAVGIVYNAEKDVYYVAVRGSKKSVWLYLIEEDKSKITYLKTFEQVGEFQNMNLFLDDRGDIYLFGMGRGQMPESTDTCMIYKIFIKEEEHSNDKKYTLQNVFIDSNDGMIKEIPHNSDEYAKYPNRMTFRCKDGTSFNWSSCVHLGTRENNTDNIPHDQTSQTMENGFQGVFTIYTTESTIPNFDDAIYGISDHGDMKCYYFTEIR